MRNISKKVTLIVMLLLMVSVFCLAGCIGTDGTTPDGTTPDGTTPDDSSNEIFVSPYLYPFTSNDLEALGYKTICNTVKTSIVGIKATSGNKSIYLSGFFISSDGYILTFGQPLPSYNDVTVMVTYHNGTKGLYTAEVIYMSNLSTVVEPALLKIKDSDNEIFDPISISSLAPSYGDPCIVMGNMNNNFLMSHSAIISKTSYKFSVNSLISIEIMLIDAPINPTYIGAPLINFKGEVTGMIIRRHPDDSYYNSAIVYGIGYVLKAKDIISFLDRHYNVY